MAPEIGRWLTTDPPVAAPDPRFMFAPWALHPYQYVHQNPVIYWDPDGKFVWFIAALVVVALVEYEGTANAPTPTTPPERIIASTTTSDLAWASAKVGISAIGGIGAAGSVKGTLLKGAVGGGTAAVIARGIDDVHHQRFSGPRVFARDAVIGAVVGAAFAGASKVLAEPTFGPEPPINASELSVPPGGRQALARLTQWTEGGRGIAGEEANFARTDELVKQLPGRIDVIRAGGVTKDMARQWARFYRQVADENPATTDHGNPNARPRAQLMDAIANEL
jgi:hypothetical protein